MFEDGYLMWCGIFLLLGVMMFFGFVNRILDLFGKTSSLVSKEMAQVAHTRQVPTKRKTTRRHRQLNSVYSCVLPWARLSQPSFTR